METMMNTTTRIAAAVMALLVLNSGAAVAGKLTGAVLGGHNGGQSDNDHDYGPIFTPKVNADIDGISGTIGVATSLDDNIQWFDFSKVEALTAKGVIAIDCDITSPTRLALVNHGSVDIPAGVTLAWAVPDADLKGTVTLKSKLSTGSRLSVRNVGSDLDRDDYCSAKPTGK
jgi:hypothetical protein